MRDIVRSDEHADTFVRLGLKPEYFGTHSICKGAITHAACGVTVSPPIASICIRANWKMSGVMNRYIRFEAAGDQYVGRSVSGRDRLSEDFAESCPYFEFSQYEPAEKERRQNLVDGWIRSRMPGGGENDNIFCIFKMCLASFIYHRPWLEANLHQDCEVRSTIFWSETGAGADNALPFSDHVVTKHLWDKTEDTPHITGLPPDVLYMAQVKGLIAKFDRLERALREDNDRVAGSILQGIEQSLDNRSVGGEGYGRLNEIHAMLNTLVQRGNLPPPTQQEAGEASVEEFVEFNCQADVEDDDNYVVEISFEESNIEQNNRASRLANDAAKRQMKKRKVSVGYHHGVLTTLPQTMVEYPAMNLQQLMSMWLMGSPSEGITALRQLNSKMVGYFDKEGAKLSRMRRLMGAVEHFAKLRGVWRPDHAQNYWNGGTVTRLWEGVWDDMKPFLETVTKYDEEDKPDSTHKSRCGDLRWRTCHDKLLKCGVFKELGL
jgi:hypothetical protein